MSFLRGSTDLTFPLPRLSAPAPPPIPQNLPGYAPPNPPPSMSFVAKPFSGGNLAASRDHHPAPFGACGRTKLLPLRPYSTVSAWLPCRLELKRKLVSGFPFSFPFPLRGVEHCIRIPFFRTIFSGFAGIRHKLFVQPRARSLPLPDQSHFTSSAFRP